MSESIAFGTRVLPKLAIFTLVRLAAARRTNASAEGLLAGNAITFATAAAAADVTFAATFTTFLIQGRLGVDDSRFRR